MIFRYLYWEKVRYLSWRICEFYECRIFFLQKLQIDLEKTKQSVQELEKQKKGAQASLDELDSEVSGGFCAIFSLFQALRWWRERK